MLKNNVFTAFFILFAFSLQAQDNLIPNGDFEQSKQHNSFMLAGDNYNENMEHWHSPYSTSSPDVISENYRPDFYPDRRDDVKHYKGKACTGIIIEKSRSEYFGVKLNKELEAGKKYKFTIHVAIYKGDDDNLENILGVLFLDEKLALNEIKKYSKLPMTPQYTLRKQQKTADEKWVKFDIYFSPKKNYEYLYIGNFKRHRIDQKKYLFIDEVSLIEINHPATKKPPVKNIQVKEKPIILENITFNYDAATLNHSSFSSLNKLLKFLNNQPNISIKIIGHTDNIGNEVYNKKLSEDRAKAIYDYLIEKGIAANRLSYQGKGSLIPRASNHTEEGRQVNRRVEYEVIR